MSPLGQRDALRSRILTEATRAFGRNGYAATSIQALVDACECTKPALYYHFGAKSGLFRATVEAASQAFLDGLAEARRTPHRSQGVQELCDLFETVNAWADANPDRIRLLLRASRLRDQGQPEVDLSACRGAFRKAVYTILEAAVLDGSAREGLELEEATSIVAAVVERSCIDRDAASGGSLIQVLIRGFATAPKAR